MTYTKISRTRARRKYADGEKILFCASKLRPDRFGAMISRDSTEDFEKRENSFSYYNCSKETGMRIAYYLVTE